MDSNAAKAYDRLGSGYDSLTKAVDRSVLDRLRRKLLQRAEGRVLDVGCGTGKNLAFLPRGCEVVGLDLSKKALEVAEAKAKRLHIPFDAEVHPADCLPFNNHEFDTVVMTLVSYNLTDARAVYEEMRRVCRPGGRVLFLEHTPPTTLRMKALFYATWPIARLALNCNPFSDNVQHIPQSGLVELSRETAADGVLQAIITVP